MRNREVQIKFYATEKERESIRRNAKRAGMKMGEYARAVLTSDDVSIKVIDTEPLKKAAHELAKQGTNLNQFMKFLNTYGVKVFDPDEAKRVLEKEVSTFSEIMEALAALRREADRNNVHLQIEDYHAMFSLYIMTGLLALVISVSLFCKSVAEAKEWKRKFGERNWDYLYRVLIALVAIATSGYAIFILFEMR